MTSSRGTASAAVPASFPVNSMGNDQPGNSLFGPTPAAEIANRIAAAIPPVKEGTFNDTSLWRERAEVWVQVACNGQADYLEELAARDDLTILRQAKELDASCAAYQAFFREHLPMLVRKRDKREHYKAALEFVQQPLNDRRRTLTTLAASLRELAAEPLTNSTEDAISRILAEIPSPARL